jgi:hypothetical protein
MVGERPARARGGLSSGPRGFSGPEMKQSAQFSFYSFSFFIFLSIFFISKVFFCLNSNLVSNLVQICYQIIL